MAFKPNRELLNPNFEGYKLSSSPLVSMNKTLDGEVHQAKLKDGDFSYQHVRAFSLHNHLSMDIYNDGSCVYWCAGDGSIQRATCDASTELSVCLVYKGDSPNPSSNTSLVFVSKELALYSSGSREVSLLYTGSRAVGNKWELVESFTLSEGSPVLINSACVAQGDHCSVQVLCAELLDSTASQNRSPLAKLTWYTIKFKCPIESLSSSVSAIHGSVEGIATVTSFESKSLPVYSAFQSHPSNGSHYLLFMSESAPNIPGLNQTSDKPASHSRDETSINSYEDVPHSDTDDHHGLGYSSQGYDWSQSDSDVTVKFELPAGVTKKEVQCVISRQELVVGLSDGSTFFRGELHETVDTEASTWTLEKDVLEVTLEKAVAGVHWPYLHKEEGSHHTQFTHEGLENSDGDSRQPEEPPEAKRPRPLVTAQLEECDSSDEDSTLYIIAQDGTLVYKASLSGRQLIFTSPSQPDHAQYFAVRHDVDAIVWLPPPITSPFPMEPTWAHVNTFNALGYVQASKANRKFTVCPPSLGFAVITDCNRHVFIYVQPVGNEADEYVYTLPEKMDIVGVAASNSGLVYVLTSKILFALKVPLTTK